MRAVITSRQRVIPSGASEVEGSPPRRMARRGCSHPSATACHPERNEPKRHHSMSSRAERAQRAESRDPLHAEWRGAVATTQRHTACGESFDSARCARSAQDDTLSFASFIPFRMTRGRLCRSGCHAVAYSARNDTWSFAALASPHVSGSRCAPHRGWRWSCSRHLPR